MIPNTSTLGGIEGYEGVCLRSDANRKRCVSNLRRSGIVRQSTTFRFGLEVEIPPHTPLYPLPAVGLFTASSHHSDPPLVFDWLQNRLPSTTRPLNLRSHRPSILASG